EGLQIVAINDLADTATLAHLLKYDSVHGPFTTKVEHDEKHLIIEGKAIAILKEKDPLKLPWKDLAVDVVIESTGASTTQEKAALQLAAGAKQTLNAARYTETDVPTVVLRVNDPTF